MVIFVITDFLTDFYALAASRISLLAVDLILGTIVEAVGLAEIAIRFTKDN